MARAYFKLYYDFIEVTEALTDAERGRLVLAVLEYARGGENPEAMLVGNERFVFPYLRRQADRDADAYEARALQNAANGRKGGRPRSDENDAINPMGFFETEKTQDKEEDEDQDQEKEKDEKKDKEEERGETRAFAPHAPALEEVLDFCRENGLRTDGQTFWHYYRAVGWRAGGRPIRDWQAKLREWEARENAGTAPRPRRGPDAGKPRAAPPNPALGYAQRDYSDDDGFYIDLDAYARGHSG